MCGFEFFSNTIPLSTFHFSRIYPLPFHRYHDKIIEQKQRLRKGDDKTTNDKNSEKQNNENMFFIILDYIILL